MQFNMTCNSTLEEIRILPTSEKAIAGSLTFHQLALIISAGSTLVAIVMSFYLIMMHATHYTKPREQKHIIRILFMVPIYASASFLSLRFYWHAIYFQVICDCYEAFAISSFFALLCHYMAPTLHDQKEYFRLMQPIKPWVWPLNWFAACCCGKRGPWRTPQSGLTWFNIIWIGIYHYCFIRVAMTISAVGSQYFDRYCESSNSPVFGHIWIICINAIAVTIAMYCLIQFYVQLRGPLAEHSPFLKVLAIKLVIFLSFWQTAAISVGTSTLNLVKPNDVLAYPDLKVGIPSLLLCFEMAIFAILHLWAFPYRPYLDNAKPTFYPAVGGLPPRENEHSPKQGGFCGVKALWDAVNLWDVVKAFGRGMRWLFVGVKHRHDDVSYQAARKHSAALAMDMDDLASSKLGVNTVYGAGMRVPAGAKSTDHLPIATEFRRSRFGIGNEPHHHQGARPGQGERRGSDDTVGGAAAEHAGLIAHAQPMEHSPARSPPEEYDGGYDRPYQPYQPQQQPYGAQQQQSYGAPQEYGAPPPQQEQPYPLHDRPTSLSTVEEESYSRAGSVAGQYGPGGRGGNPRNSTQLKLGNALWGGLREQR
ncbi:putative DUF300 domain protein [Coniochaeta sp. 2T2.1]|nr:putative DUF300 domain protein [Coniochaeta sp. 2T2.1]